MNSDAENRIRELNRQIIEGELPPSRALARMSEWTYQDSLAQCEKVAKMESDRMFKCGISTAAHYIEMRSK